MEGDPAIEGTAPGNIGLFDAQHGYPRRALPHLRHEIDLLVLTEVATRLAEHTDSAVIAQHFPLVYRA